MTDHLPASGTPRPARCAAAAIAVLLTLTAACAPAAGTPTPSGGPASTPTSTPAPTISGIEHPTGATDIILRFEEGGGFVPVDFLATQAPSFTLYGDGTVVFRDPQAIPPDPVGNVNRSVPFQTIRLGEEGIQALIEQALGPGGLGVAIGPYMGLGADIPTATFTLNADGREKQVSVVGLSPDMHPQDTLIVTSLSSFADRLRTFGNNVAGEVVYEPAAYRGTLQKVDAANGAVIEWPWTDLEPADFAAGVNDFLLLHTLTAAQVAKLAIPEVEGGMLGLNIQRDGKLYSLALRPLLPDEKS